MPPGVFMAVNSPPNRSKLSLGSLQSSSSRVTRYCSSSPMSSANRATNIWRRESLRHAAFDLRAMSLLKHVASRSAALRVTASWSLPKVGFSRLGKRNASGP